MKTETKTKFNAYMPLFIAVITLFVTIALFFLEGERQRKHELLEHRREAIFEAFLVIDKVYANSNFNDKEPLHPVGWDIQLARTAANKLLIYTENPKVTVKAFHDAIGLHNPEFEPAPIYSAVLLNEFRLQAAKELEITTARFFDHEKAWISELPGTQ